MTLTIELLFKNSFVISTSNKEQSELFDFIFNKNNLNPLPYHYPGFESKAVLFFRFAPLLVIALSHASIIRLAKYLNLPYVLIFENDAYPCFNIRQKLLYYLTDIPDDCECLSLGWTCSKIFGDVINGKYYRSDFNIGAHAYIVFRNGYDKHIETVNTNPEKAPGDGAITQLKMYRPIENLFILFNKDGKSTSFTGNQYPLADEEKIDLFKRFPKFEEFYF